MQRDDLVQREAAAAEVLAITEQDLARLERIFDNPALAGFADAGVVDEAVQDALAAMEGAERAAVELGAPNFPPVVAGGGANLAPGARAGGAGAAAGGAGGGGAGAGAGAGGAPAAAAAGGVGNANINLVGNDNQVFSITLSAAVRGVVSSLFVTPIAGKLIGSALTWWASQDGFVGSSFLWRVLGLEHGGLRRSMGLFGQPMWAKYGSVSGGGIPGISLYPDIDDMDPVW